MNISEEIINYYDVWAIWYMKRGSNYDSDDIIIRIWLIWVFLIDSMTCDSIL